MKPFVPCEDCKDSPIKGYVKLINRSYIGSGSEVWRECKCHKRWIREIATEGRIKKSGLPNIDYDLNSYVGTKSAEAAATLKRYAAEWPTNESLRDKFIYVYGPNGCQKTTFITMIGREICKSSSVIFLPVKRLYDTLRDSFTNPESRSKLEKWQSFDLMIIDEAMDPAKVAATDWSLTFLDSFLRERLDYQRKGLIMISNVAPENIDVAVFKASVKDLIIRKSIGTRFEFADNYTANMLNDVSVNYDAAAGLFPKDRT